MDMLFLGNFVVEKERVKRTPELHAEAVGAK
jgi:hypothetical protein